MARKISLALLAGATIVLPMLPGPAQAHAAYRGSDPPDGATVASPPSGVWAEFTEQPSNDSRLDIFDPCGAKVDLGDSSVSVVPGENRITTGMSADKSGTYRVEWHVLSTEDGHPTSGTFTFTSSGGEPCPGAARPDDPPDESVEASPDADPSPQEDSEKAGADGPSGKNEVRRPRREEPGTPIPDENEVFPAAQPTPVPPPREPDIPLDGLAFALGVAAAIGAAGGRVYANVMGPPR